ncbi:antA/AntB antirepressor family protein [Arsenophonus nasoniae]|uniref:AntA/AntB antirepressor family protein n=2 Tax=Arsenophonus nasoniae TaxID=638 RepID=A0AA95GJA2_9GAMM|nr:antA/AntB antirepressor family protein [Arsenophonus nasoniae]WGM00063.1 antA/AntB antirepressor family protein [Arsenophonus nasoniae]
MSNLINIETKNINGALIQTVNARNLHAFLEITTRFNDWINRRIAEYSFEENIDYIIVENLSYSNLSSAKSRKRLMKDYCISIDMAKELSMVERNEKGKQARQYFIECERRVLQPQTLLPTAKELALMVVRAEEEKEQLLLENKSLSTENDCLKNLFKEGMTPTQFSKMLNGVNSQQINHFLAGLKWLYNESKSGNNLRWRVAATARDKYLTEKQNEISPHGANSFISYRPVLLRKGAQRLYDQYLADKLPMKKNWNGLHTHDKTIQIVA